MSNFKLCVHIRCWCDDTVFAFVFCLCDENKNNLKCFPNTLIFLEDMSAQINEKRVSVVSPLVTLTPFNF